MWTRRARQSRSEVRPSPNIWHWPDLYDVENHAQDRAGALWCALRSRYDWTGRDVVDVGCGDGFHLPAFAETARTVLGVEPHPPLAERAKGRCAGLSGVEVRRGTAQRLPVPDASADLVHARTAYFFGPGCEPGLAEAERVLRPGGVLAIVDLDAAAAGYGEWMRADLPKHDPAEVERFFTRHGFVSARIDTQWVFEDRESLAAVLGIEFSRKTASRAVRETPGLALSVAYRLRTRTKPSGFLLPL